MKKALFNPYLPPYEYIPDGEPRIFDGRLYIYGSHDRFNGKWYCEENYVTWSAPLNDLSDWRYEGVIYRRDQDPRPGNLYAPDVVNGLDGRFYLYYSKDDSSVISVAVSDRPTGPFAYYGDVSYPDGRILGNDEKEYFMFDPSVLIDEGRIWLYSGSSKRVTTTKIKRKMVGCTVTELYSDMKTVKQDPKVILEGSAGWNTDAYFEGPSARKINDLYYVVYPVRNASGLHYAISHYPDKDFVHRGCLHSTSNIGIDGHTVLDPAYPLGNSHGGLVNLHGDWFIFDHRHTNGTGFSRQGVAEKLVLNPDGTFDQAEATSYGLRGKPFEDSGTYPAYIACVLIGRKLFGRIGIPKWTPFVTQSTAEAEESTDYYVSNIGNKAICGFKYFDFKGGSYRLTIVYRGAAGKLMVADDKSLKPAAFIEITESGEWKKAEIRLQIEKGTRPLYMGYRGFGKIDIKEFSLDRKGE